MQSRFNAVRCLECGHELPAHLDTHMCPACNSPWLDARYDLEGVADIWRAGLSERPSSLWRYAELLPVEVSTCISMGEGWTPLLPAERLGQALGHERLFIKDERQAPTSSFKDRQAALVVSAMRQIGLQECVMASTGNASAAYAAYCARAGIKLWAFVTSAVPADKIREAALYGAEVIKVTGTYEQTKKVAADFATRRGLHLDRGAKDVAGKDSMKTIAFELAEQLGWQAPGWYIQAVSGGIGPLGVWKGFGELYNAGLVDHMPKLAIIQAEGCSPMASAFQAGQAEAAPVVPHTRIAVLATSDPGLCYTMLRQAVLSNGGTMLAVSDEEAFGAMRRLARAEGFSVEPATAVAFAGLERMLAEGLISPDETVVVCCSGHTFPVEKFILGDQYALDLYLSSDVSPTPSIEEGLGAALERLDEQVTTVVVVDDNPQDARLVRRLLQAHKAYRVFEAGSGTQALQLVHERRPDLIILDLMMPDMDGFDVLEALKTNPDTADIPVIVLSAKTLTARDRRRLAGHTKSVWQKGNFRTRELVRHVVDTLGSPWPVTETGPGMVQESPIGQVETAGVILLIEDNPLDARLLRRVLQAQRPYQVYEAGDGQQAINAIHECRPDLIILDLILPGMDGFEVLDKIRSEEDICDIPVIVLSAKELSQAERQALCDRVEALWSKSGLDRAALQACVERVIVKAG
jgi:threonine synthase